MKLVRDKIPQLHAQGGLGSHPSRPDRSHQVFRRAKPEEYLLFLLAKLAEETGEVVSAMTRGHRLEELGDLRDVIGAIEKFEDMDLADTEKRAAKREMYGVFAEGWVLEWSPTPPPVERPEPKIGDHVYGRTIQTTIAGFDEDGGTRLSTGAWICASRLEYLATGVWKVKDKAKE